MRIVKIFFQRRGLGAKPPIWAWDKFPTSLLVDMHLCIATNCTCYDMLYPKFPRKKEPMILVQEKKYIQKT